MRRFWFRLKLGLLALCIMVVAAALVAHDLHIGLYIGWLVSGVLVGITWERVRWNRAARSPYARELEDEAWEPPPRAGLGP